VRNKCVVENQGRAGGVGGAKWLKKLEAWPRIELGCADLQSAASPLRHQAA
jgi:hypothetical protein